MFPFIFVTIRYYKLQATAAVFSRKQSFQTNLFNITQKLIVLPNCTTFLPFFGELLHFQLAALAVKDKKRNRFALVAKEIAITFSKYIFFLE